MFVQLDEMTDEPVCVGLTGSGRVRIAYSSNVVITLDIGEAVDLVTAVAETLAEADNQSQSRLRRDESAVRSQAAIREALQ
ncbi:hypothetical protein CH260_10385 [Rhodococcus sp. 05-2256-B2]|uniref:hypothetical protein n=1 Tax=unclassified Rhodococcus (in: high G+C Gram-positive bacteria) TaxID=192944 RepID=UPI000B9A4D35|nr:MULTISPECIES: hypothetical protein [unclassified Rhodococcus (in: high G+C Gram-positive bacteria)]OZD81816.1 hypothetical protein CH258_19795 [Rhodococcus sp. 05-2256-B4]OZD90437.1 hypothetical protein CH257_18190 [Rhodococcus sp. 05-2256-B3]OZD96939.1 hypothetical protein CH260_10385 [Rhodococcus sp. 05-2256-B2]OZE00439.1 hypothetical protein CH285_19440 [Rhodococcus sp. 05-2256-B1]